MFDGKRSFRLTFLFQEYMKNIWKTCKLSLTLYSNFKDTKHPRLSSLDESSPGLSCAKNVKQTWKKCCLKVEQNWETPCFPFLGPSEFTTSYFRCFETATIILWYFEVFYGLQSKHKYKDHITWSPEMHKKKWNPH